MQKMNLNNHAKNSMLHRRLYNYSIKDYCYNLFCWLKCINYSKKNPYSLYNRYKLYKRGVEKFEKELDIEHYAKSLRNLKIMASAMMDDNKRVMSTYQHWNSIPLIGSRSESDSENETTTKMPNFLDNKNKVHSYSKYVDTFLSEYYAGKQTAKDYRLLKGAYTSKKLKKNELEKLTSDNDGISNRIDENSGNNNYKFNIEKTENLDIQQDDDIFYTSQYKSDLLQSKKIDIFHPSPRPKSHY